jgi:hypothetical protein
MKFPLAEIVEVIYDNGTFTKYRAFLESPQSGQKLWRLTPISCLILHFQFAFNYFRVPISSPFAALFSCVVSSEIVVSSKRRNINLSF